MFIGVFELAASWSDNGVAGCRRFLERVWKLQDMVVEGDSYSSDIETLMHKTIKKVTTDYEALKYNTAIAALMSLTNEFYRKGSLTKGEYKTLLILLNPVAPHMTEALWGVAGFEGRLYKAEWVKWDEAKTVENTVEIAIQINGKLKGTIKVGVAEDQEAIKPRVWEFPGVAAAAEGKTVVKEIYVSIENKINGVM